MRVLVTRALDDANRTASALAQRGHQALVAPLFAVRIFDGPELTLQRVQAILATSGNGIRALARRSTRRDIPVFCVGSRTAETARTEGFLCVADAAGDATTLAALVRDRLPHEGGVLLRAAGMSASAYLEHELTRAGFEIRTCPLYEVCVATRLPDVAVEALRDRLLDAVLLFSPRSARVFAERVMQADLAAACRHPVACCISKTAAEGLAGLEFGEIRVAARPDEDSIFALLK